MENVDVVEIDEKGNIFLRAPKYQIIEETNFEPLSRYFHKNKSNQTSPIHMKKKQILKHPYKKDLEPIPSSFLEEDLKPASKDPSLLNKVKIVEKNASVKNK